MNRSVLLAERNRLLKQYLEAKGVERLRIIGKLVVIDEELEGEEKKWRSMSTLQKP